MTGRMILTSWSPTHNTTLSVFILRLQFSLNVSWKTVEHFIFFKFKLSDNVGFGFIDWGLRLPLKGVPYSVFTDRVDKALKMRSS